MMTYVIELSGCTIINDKNEILVLYKIKQDHYELPGGKVEDGETFEEAAIRECKEEIGVDVNTTTYTGFYEFSLKGKTFRSHMFTAKIPLDQTATICEPEVFSKLIWMPINNYQEYVCAPNLKLLCEKLSKY